MMTTGQMDIPAPRRTRKGNIEVDGHSIVDSGERLFPDYIAEHDPVAVKLLRHTEQRYRYAARYASGRVLDLACGSGWGTELLAASATEVIGVEPDSGTIAFARARHGAAHISFEQAGAETFDAAPFDLITCLETLEHVDRPQVALANLVRMLKEGGVIAVSVTVSPTRDFYSFHKHDFSEAELERICADQGLRIIDRMLIVDHFSASELRSSFAQHRTSLDIPHILASPLRWAATVGSSFIWKGLPFRNLTLLCAR